jgi:hypothetical protein
MTDNDTLKALAAKALEYVPPKLSSICVSVSAKINEALESSHRDLPYVQEISSHVKQGLLNQN